MIRKCTGCIAKRTDPQNVCVNPFYLKGALMHFNKNSHTTKEANDVMENNECDGGVGSGRSSLKSLGNTIGRGDLRRGVPLPLSHDARPRASLAVGR